MLIHPIVISPRIKLIVPVSLKRWILAIAPNIWPKPKRKTKNIPGIKKSPKGAFSMILSGIPTLVPSGCKIIRIPGGIADKPTNNCKIINPTDNSL